MEDDPSSEARVVVNSNFSNSPLDVIAWFYGVTWLLALLDFSEHPEGGSEAAHTHVSGGSGVRDESRCLADGFRGRQDDPLDVHALWEYIRQCRG